jgi:hypothetical protein
MQPRVFCRSDHLSQLVSNRYRMASGRLTMCAVRKFCSNVVLFLTVNCLGTCLCTPHFQDAPVKTLHVARMEHQFGDVLSTGTLDSEPVVSRLAVPRASAQPESSDTCTLSLMALPWSSRRLPAEGRRRGKMRSRYTALHRMAEANPRDQSQRFRDAKGDSINRQR